MIKISHSKLRALQRYGICNFKPSKVLEKIIENNAILIEVNLNRASSKYLLRYENKYIVAVVDIGLNFIKTLLPYESKYDKVLEKLIK